MNIDLPQTDKTVTKIFRFKHLPSGLFYKPSNGMTQPNLSKKGKLYHKRPSFSWIEKWVDVDGKLKTGDPKDWEIIEINA